jgi:hypothetical protein
MTGTPYEERYCAYIDILGFRDLVAKLAGDHKLFDEIRAVLHQVQNPLAGITKPALTSSTYFGI